MNGNKPTLIAYSVKDARGEEAKAIWTRIGRGWAHEHGPGYSIPAATSPALSIGGGQIVDVSSRLANENPRRDVPTAVIGLDLSGVPGDRCSYTSADTIDAFSLSLPGTVSRMSAIG